MGNCKYERIFGFSILFFIFFSSYFKFYLVRLLLTTKWFILLEALLFYFVLFARLVFISLTFLNYHDDHHQHDHRSRIQTKFKVIIVNAQFYNLANDRFRRSFNEFYGFLRCFFKRNAKNKRNILCTFVLIPIIFIKKKNITLMPIIKK